MKLLPWKEDRWLSKNGSILPWDKAEHLLRDYAICNAFGLFEAIIFNLLWEFLDGVRPWREDGGVEGFSIKDMLAGLAGAAIGYFIKGDYHGWLS